MSETNSVESVIMCFPLNLTDKRNRVNIRSYDSSYIIRFYPYEYSVETQHESDERTTFSIFFLFPTRKDSIKTVGSFFVTIRTRPVPSSCSETFKIQTLKTNVHIVRSVI